VAGCQKKLNRDLFSMSQNALSEIRAFRLIEPGLGTSGQPTALQFKTIREAGFEAVINLALPTSDHAIPEEGSLVSALGMAYLHLPVNFAQPTAQAFQTFCGLMKALQGQKIFVHCAANMRVSAFVFLYRVLQSGVPVEQAEQDLQAIWEPDEVWARFIRTQLQSGPRPPGTAGVPPANGSTKETRLR